MSQWNKFVKCFAEEHNLTYGQALVNAKEPYQQWKAQQEQQVKAHYEKQKPVKQKEQKMSKKEIKKNTKAIKKGFEEGQYYVPKMKYSKYDMSSSDESSEGEYIPAPKKKVVKKKVTKQKSKKAPKQYISSGEELETPSESSGSDDQYIVVQKRTKRKY